MSSQDILKGKRILAVDDEPDMLEVVQEQLEECEVTTAKDFAAAYDLLLAEKYDLAILDIMGVNGFALLDVCVARAIPAAMFTAHAANLASINLAMKLGAVSFLPKDEVSNLPEYVAEILECAAKNETHWSRLFKRLGPLFKERLGIDVSNLKDTCGSE